MSNNHYYNHNSYNSGGSSSGSDQVFTNGDGNKHDYSHHQSVVRLTNGYIGKPVESVAVPDMCLFCFEVLDCELNNMEGPGTPPFTNEA